MSEVKKLEILTDILGNSIKVGHEHLFFCPKVECEHPKKKMSVNFEKNKFKCWICGYSGSSIFKMVRRFGTFQHKNEWPKEENEFRRLEELPKVMEELFGEKEEEEKLFKLPSEFTSLTFKTKETKEARQYFTKRGGEREDLLLWKPGFCQSGEFAERILFPSFNLDGNINFFVGRTVNRKEWPPYKNTETSRNIIFNELFINWDKPIILTEGIFDAIISGKNSIPLLGSTLRENSKLFEKIIQEDAVVYLALDPDAEKKSFELLKRFLEYNIDIFKVNIGGFKDVGEMEKKEFQKRKAEAKLITLDNFFSTKIHSILGVW